MLGVSPFTQVRDGIRYCDLRQRSKFKDAALYANQLKIRWAGHVMRVKYNHWTRAVSDWIRRDVKRTPGIPPSRSSEFFAKSLEERYDPRRVPRPNKTHGVTLSRGKEKWKIYWRSLESVDDQRDYR
uniref:Transposase n=1 Tax=Angiostrongylus cantonensis TaxID=6313 RepID=A0A0K0D9T2_ANGCA